jgi:hypothetical protein
MRTQSSWKWIAGGAAVLLLALIMACVVGGAAVERGALPPVQVNVRVGSLSFETVVTDDASCWRPVRGNAGPLCSTGSLYRSNWYYIAWLGLRDQQNRRVPPIYHKLFVIRLSDR